MNKKGFFKALRHALSIHALRFYIKLSHLFKLSFIYSFGAVLAGIVYLFSKKYKQTARESLSTAFGDSLSEQEKVRIIRANFKETIQSFLETCALFDRKDFLIENVAIKGEENLKKALSKGNGVICLSAHLGNFLLLIDRLACAGFPMAAVLKPMRDKKIDRFLLEKMSEVNVRGIYSKPAKKCLVDSVAFLKQNGIIFMPLDQNFGSAGAVFVDFFAKPAATAAGPVVMAMRSKAAIVPMFMIRKQLYKQEIVIDPEYIIEKLPNYEDSVYKAVADLTKIIEGYVRRYPERWSWIHRRWKSRPNEGTTYGVGKTT